MFLKSLQLSALFFAVSLLTLPAIAASSLAPQSSSPLRPSAIISQVAHPALATSGTARAATRVTTSQAAAAAVPLVSGPAITTQPVSQSWLVGTNAYFEVFASDTTGPMSYQWKQGSTPIATGTSATLRLNNVQPASNGAQYSVVVSDTTGAFVTSNTVTLTVLASAALTSPTLPTISQTVYLVTSYGAVGDGATDNTTAIQSALTAASSGGGIVEFPPASGTYLSGPLTLKSNTDLQVDSGAELQALPYYTGTATTIPAGFYPINGSSFNSFITCSSSHDVEICGPGKIDGQGAPWWTAYTANGSLPHRPYLVDFSNGSRVLITNVTATNSPSFHFAVNASNLTVFNTTVSDSNPNNNALNTDGIDPSGSHILVQNCSLGDFDDDICLKPEGTFCSDITIAYCFIGTGHGLSMGGQTNAGLNGMVVTSCTFNGTTSGLRMKADPTEGGLVTNVSYSNLVMTNVTYPIVFYSYYNKIGNPGGTSTSTAQADNQTPPNSLNTTTIPVWENISINNLTATGATGDSILWGLPLSNAYIMNVVLNNVKISGGSFQIYDCTNVQFTGTTSVGSFITNNSLAITSQPQSQTVDTGSSVTMTSTTVGTSGASQRAPSYQWDSNNSPLTNGTNSDGSIVSGVLTNTLQIKNLQTGEAGSYTMTASNFLDTYSVSGSAYSPNSASVAATSAAATLTVLTPFQAWATGFGLNPAGNGAETANPSGDGMPNLLTYVLGGNPTKTNTALLPTASVATTSGTPTLTYQFDLNKTAVAANPVTIQYSPDLINWTTAVNGQNGITITITSLNSTTEQMTATIPSANSTLFARLLVTP